MSKIIKFTIIALLLTQPFYAKALEITRKDNKVILKGIITDGDGGRFLAVSQGATGVVVDSPGGVAIEALIIAEEIEKRHMSIRVSGECGSACAEYILVAGDPREIDKGSIILFHGYLQAWAEEMLDDLNKIPESARALSLYKAIIATEDYRKAKLARDGREALFKRKGISLEALRNIQRATSFTRNEYLGVGLNPDDRTHLYPGVRNGKDFYCLFWAPDNTALQEIGISTKTPYILDMDMLTPDIPGTYKYGGNRLIFTGSAFDLNRIASLCHTDGVKK